MIDSNDILMFLDNIDYTDKIIDTDEGLHRNCLLMINKESVVNV